MALTFKEIAKGEKSFIGNYCTLQQVVVSAVKLRLSWSMSEQIAIGERINQWIILGLAHNPTKGGETQFIRNR